MTDKRRNLDEITVSTEHAEVMHPLRALMDRHFYVDGIVSSDGGLWLVMICALLFVPYMMALLFYPLASFLWLVAVLVVVCAIYAGTAVWKRRHRVRV
jgi:Flp pilus assembly protein TadB